MRALHFGWSAGHGCQPRTQHAERNKDPEHKPEPEAAPKGLVGPRIVSFHKGIDLLGVELAGLPPASHSPINVAMNDEPHAQFRQMQGELRENKAEATREAPMGEALFAQVWERPWIAVALMATLPGFVLALLGPFGSFLAPFWMRLAYWVRPWRWVQALAPH